MRHYLGALVVLAWLLVPLGSSAATPALLAALEPLALDPALDRVSPRRTVAAFLKEAREGDFTAAAHCLDLRDLPVTNLADEGPKLAEELSYVLYRQPPIDMTKVPDDPEGGTPPTHSIVVTSVMRDDEPVPFSLTRARFSDGIYRWVVSRTTVAMIPSLSAAYQPKSWLTKMPRPLLEPVVLGNAPWQWLGVFGGALAAYVLGRILAAVLVRVAGFAASHTKSKTDDLLVVSSRRPLRLILAASLFGGLMYLLQISRAVSDLAGHAVYTCLVIGVAWLIISALSVLTSLLQERIPVDRADELRTRGARTRTALLQRIAAAVVIGIAIAVILLQFELVRHVGISLLASAGIVSVVVGIAAQKSLAGVIAGVQLSISQPVRIGDSVVLDGEFGEVEELMLTYAVVRLWDQRRLIVPISRFLEQPFENWTKVSHDILGTVSLQVDYTTPLEPLRAKLAEVCKASSLWDGRACNLQVTDSDASGMTVRAVVSAKDASAVWDLRCLVREKMIEFLHAMDGGRHLARTRHMVDGPLLSAASGVTSALR